MSAWAWLVANPRVALRVAGYGTLVVVIGLLILRAERAERLRAVAERRMIEVEFDHEGDRQRLKESRQLLQAWEATAKRETERRIVAERKARAVRIRTVERVRVVREAVVPTDCTAAIEWAATEAPRVAEWGGKL